MTDPAAVPVIIVGAGPVGLCAALSLARQGVESVVLEREAELHRELGASTFHPPTLEMLEEIGLTDEILRRGLIARTWQFRQHETHERVVFDLDVIAGDTRHPYRVQLDQSAFTRLALGAAQAEPRITLRFSAEVRGLARLDGGVNVTWNQAGVRERLQARYVIAADGATSTVRRLVGLPFEGAAAPETTVIATTAYPFDDHLPGLSPVNYVWTRNGRYALLRQKDRWRVSLYADPGEDPAADAWRFDDPARIERKLQRLVPKLGTYEVLEHRPYRVHERIVPAYRSGNVLLAGDAAHVNSPSGGMGMNCGIHDAFSLAHLLAQVLAGSADGLLDRYERQRRPVAAAEILRKTAAPGRTANHDPASRREALKQLQAIAGDPERAREYLLVSSMIAGLRRAAAVE